MKTVQYQGWNCQIVFERGKNDRLAIQLKTELGTLITQATLDLSYVPLQVDEVLVKDFDENEGLLASLVEAEVVEPTEMTIREGKDVLHVCRLLDFEDVIASLE